MVSLAIYWRVDVWRNRLILCCGGGGTRGHAGGGGRLLLYASYACKVELSWTMLAVIYIYYNIINACRGEHELGHVRLCVCAFYAPDVSERKLGTQRKWVFVLGRYSSWSVHAPQSPNVRARGRARMLEIAAKGNGAQQNSELITTYFGRAVVVGWVVLVASVLRSFRVIIKVDVHEIHADAVRINPAIWADGVVLNLAVAKFKTTPHVWPSTNMWSMLNGNGVHPKMNFIV